MSEELTIDDPYLEELRQMESRLYRPDESNLRDLVRVLINERMRKNAHLLAVVQRSVGG